MIYAEVAVPADDPVILGIQEFWPVQETVFTGCRGRTSGLDIAVDDVLAVTGEQIIVVAGFVRLTDHAHAGCYALAHPCDCVAQQPYRHKSGQVVFHFIGDIMFKMLLRVFRRVFELALPSRGRSPGCGKRRRRCSSSSSATSLRMSPGCARVTNWLC